jgi:tetratricopeptide (TPR) repeat protein
MGRLTAGIGIALGLALALPGPAARAQEGPWEALITAGETALQQGDYATAEEQFTKALEAAEQFPKGDDRLGKSLNNLAAAYYAQEDYGRAEPLMRRAVSVLEETQGPDSPDVAQSMKNLAALYYLQEDYAQAEPLLQQGRVRADGRARRLAPRGRVLPRRLLRLARAGRVPSRSDAASHRERP